MPVYAFLLGAAMLAARPGGHLEKIAVGGVFGFRCRQKQSVTPALVAGAQSTLRQNDGRMGPGNKSRDDTECLAGG
ncbi:MAG: hypothetical protein C0454_06485 [Parvibaculum sp.]|nr:hypothetical protein [Parvibaculum sp.]